MQTGEQPHIAVVAGDNGDVLGAHLIEALRAVVPLARFCGVGGAKMQSVGFEAWYPAEDRAPSDSFAAARERWRDLTIRRELSVRFRHQPPDLFIGIGLPDFNLPIAEQLRAAGVETVQYGLPQPFAGRGHRLHQLRRAASRVLTQLPFELQALNQAGVPATFVGHLLADQLPFAPDQASAREQFRLSASSTVVAMLPGSHPVELKRTGDVFAQTAKLIHRQLPSTHFLVPLRSRLTRREFEDAIYRNDAQELPITILFGHAHMAMTAADGVLLALGTAALEAALLKRTMVVTGRLSPRAYRRLRQDVGLPYLSLPNLLLGKFVVPELLQEQASAENLSQALVNQIADKSICARQERAFRELHLALRQDTAQRLRDALLPMLGRRAAPASSLAPTADSAGA